MELQKGKRYRTRTGETLIYLGPNDDRTRAQFGLLDKDGAETGYFLSGPQNHLEGFIKSIGLREDTDPPFSRPTPPPDTL